MTQVLHIQGPATLIITEGDVKLEDLEQPMVAILFRKSTSTRSYGYVLEPDEVQPRIWAETNDGRTQLIAQQNVPKGQYDDLPEGTDTGNVPDGTKNACWWYSENKPPPPGEGESGRWGTLDKPRNADLDNGSEARVVVTEGTFEPLPPGTPEWKPPEPAGA